MFMIKKELLMVCTNLHTYILTYSRTHSPYSLTHSLMITHSLTHDYSLAHTYSLTHLTRSDFVFITFFVGNDFLPHALSIVDHAIELMFQSYKDRFIQPRQSDYLITRGKLDFGRLEALLQALLPEESKILTSKYAHLQQQYYIYYNKQHDLHRIIDNEVGTASPCHYACYSLTFPRIFRLHTRRKQSMIPKLSIKQYYFSMLQCCKMLNSSTVSHSLTQSLTHSLTHLLTHSLTHLLTHSLTHSLTHLLTHSLTHSLMLAHSLSHSLTHLLTYSLTHSCSRSSRTHLPCLLLQVIMMEEQCINYPVWRLPSTHQSYPSIRTMKLFIINTKYLINPLAIPMTRCCK